MEERPAELIVRLPNWIGDCVMALPALHALHDAGLALTGLGRGWLPALFAGTGWSLAELPRPLGAGARTLRGLPPRHLLLLTHSLSSAVMGRLAGKRLCGYARDGRGLLLQRRLAWPRDEHEVRRYWRLADATLRWLGRPPLTGEPPACRLPLAPDALAAARAALAAVDAGDEAVLLCPLATGTHAGGHDKQWPDYPALAAALRAAGRRVVVVAPPGKRDELAARFGDCPLVGDLPIAVFAAVLSLGDTVVANNSGPMHVACAVGTRCVATLSDTDTRTALAWSDLLTTVQEPSGWPTVDAVLAALDTRARG